MTGRDDFDRTLASWFEADALSPAPAGSLDRILDATRRRRPRPAWLAGPGSRWVGEAHAASTFRVRSKVRSNLRWSPALIVLLATLALLGGAFLIGARLAQPAPLLTGVLGHIAYSLNGDIYVADWDGRNPVRIADGAPAAGPAACESFVGAQWSPDGRHLLYRSIAEGCADSVFISDPAGRTLASFRGPGAAWSVRWSPDSTRVSMWVEPGRTIGLYGLDGARQTLISVPAGLAQGGEFDAVWSPDGRSLLLNLYGCPVGVRCLPVQSQMWELPVDGGPARPVTAGDPRSRRAVYSRDGTRVAFVDWPRSYSLVIAEVDGTQLQVLPGARAERPDPGEHHRNLLWSPSGDRVAFSRSLFEGSYSEDGMPLESALELRVVEVTSGKVTTLVAGRDIHAIGFSPEGDRILFSRTSNSLWTVNSDGSDPQLLVAGAGDGAWQWRLASP